MMSLMSHSINKACSVSLSATIILSHNLNAHDTILELGFIRKSSSF